MTIREIAKLSGVSPSTVSKVLNRNDASISEATRQKILAIVKDYNYRPYSFVSNLSSSKTCILGLIFQDTIPDDRFLKGMVDRARSYGYGITVLESRRNPAQELKNLTLLASNNVDGILFNPIGDTLSDPLQSQLKRFKGSCLLFETDCDNHGADSPLVMDYADMAKYLTQQLVNAGHSDIALITEKEDSVHTAFLEGFKKCMYENSLHCSDDLLFETDSDKFYQRIASGTVSAVLTLHFQTSFRVYQQLLDRHLQVPYDISLLTLCKHLSNMHNFSDISALLIPFQEYGEYLTQCLVNRIEATKSEESEDLFFKVDYRLNHRRSIAPPSVVHRKKAVILGSVNIDSYLSFPELPRTGMSVRTTHSSSYPGGKGMNQAVGVARLGHSASIIGMVGDDIEADTIYETAKRNAVDTGYLRRNRNERTGKAYIFLDDKGASMISILSGANESISAEYIRKTASAFKDSDICLISTEMPQDAVLEACRISHNQRIRTILKPSSLTEIDGRILSLTDILIPNLDEVCVLVPGADALLKKRKQRTGAPDEAALEQCADYFLTKGVGIVILTLGEYGMFAKGEGLCALYPAKKVTAIDTTGAADAFISALASYLLYGYPIDSAIRIASYAAALSITREGVVPSLADKSALESYIAKCESRLLDLHLKKI